MKKLLSVLLAIIMVTTMMLGSVVNVSATNESVTMDELGDKTMDVTLGYDRDNVSGGGGGDEGGGDDSEKDVYSIKIAYDNLTFAYKATKITWNQETLQYDVTTERTDGGPKAIQVTNKSNVNVKVSPNIVDTGVTKPVGVKYKIDLKRDDTSLGSVSDTASSMEEDSVREKVLQCVIGSNVDNLTVDSEGVTFNYDVQNIDSTKLATVSLSFEKAA